MFNVHRLVFCWIQDLKFWNPFWKFYFILPRVCTLYIGGYGGVRWSYICDKDPLEIIFITL